MIDTGQTHTRCGGWSEKRANGPRKDEGTCRSKLRRMQMMGKWMETRA
jgi:hypothetical protein